MLRSVRHAVRRCGRSAARAILLCPAACVLLLCTGALAQDTLCVVSSIRFEGDSAAGEPALRRLAETAEGSLLQQPVVERDIQAILSHYTELGFPFAEIRIRAGLDDSLEPPRARVVFSIREGPGCWFVK